MNQLLEDKLEFQECFCKFTGVSALKLSAFLRENEVRTLFEHPEAIGVSHKQLSKINGLMRLYGLYNNLKTPDKVYQMSTSSRAGAYFINLVGAQRDKEYFYCSMLNAQNEVIHTRAVHEGTLNEAPVYPREIVFQALRYGAHSIILAHNHPGGSLTASSADLDVTKRIVASFKPISIPVVDHIIVANGGYTSLAEEGVMMVIQQQVSAEPSKGYAIAEKTISIADRMESARATVNERPEKEAVGTVHQEER